MVKLDDSGARAGSRFTLADHLARAVDRVALEQSRIDNYSEWVAV